jgi:hypothetical protein
MVSVIHFGTVPLPTTGCNCRDNDIEAVPAEFMWKFLHAYSRESSSFSKLANSSLAFDGIL